MLVFKQLFTFFKACSSIKQLAFFNVKSFIVKAPELNVKKLFMVVIYEFA
jgi:hypothetical protein